MAENGGSEPEPPPMADNGGSEPEPSPMADNGGSEPEPPPMADNGGFEPEPPPMADNGGFEQKPSEIETVVLVLNQLPIDDEAFPEVYEMDPGDPIPLEALAATYHHALDTILSSYVNRAGRLRSVLVRFVDDWFHIDPHNYFFDDVNEVQFKHMLRELFTYRQLCRGDGTNQPVWTIIDDISAFLTDMDNNNARIVGCVSQLRAREDTRDYRGFIFGPSFEDFKVIVIGKFLDDPDLRSFSTETIKVSNKEQPPAWTATLIITALEVDWGLT